MGFLKLFVACVALTSVAMAQSDSNTQLQIEAIIQHFTNAELVPVPVPEFNPTAILTANFAGVGNITPGQPLTQDQVKNAPALTLTPANSSVNFDGKYTLAMIDPAAVGSDESGGQTRHWLVNGATVSGGTVSISSGTQVTQYAGPAPPSGSGPHRYTIVLYEQPDSFTPPSDLSSANQPVSAFDFPSYVKSTGLGPIVAGIYYTVEVGTASSSIPATSSVVTSTLPAAHSTGSPAPSGAAPSGGGNPNSGLHSFSVASGSILAVTAAMSYIML